MAKNHKAVGSPATTKTKLDKPPIKQNGTAKQKPTKKQIGIICGIIAVLVVALVVTLILVLGHNQPQEETTDSPETTQDEQKVDYNQKITNEDGGEFKAEYQAGSEQSFAMRFADLKCEDDCKNVSEVKLGDKVLKQGEDYKVEKGSIIIILTETFMKSLQANSYDLILVVINEDTTSIYGVKFTVKPEPTCNEGEILEKGKCVKKSEQPTQNQAGNTTATRPSNSQSTTQSTTQPSQSAASSKSQAQIECEKKTGPISFEYVARPRNATDKYAALGGEFYDENYSSPKATTMVWVNGTCRPHAKDVPSVGGYAPSFTAEELKTQYPEIYSLMMSHPNKDLVTWYWKDGTKVNEFVDNAWSYIMSY